MKYDVSGSHGPAWGAVNAGLTCLAVAFAGHVWETYGDFPVWMPLTTACIGVAVSVFVGKQRRASAKSIYYRAGCWTFAGIWATWAAFHPFTVRNIFILFAVCLTAAMLAPLLASMQPDPEAQKEEVKSEVGVVSERELLRLIVKYGNVKEGEWPTVRKIADWEPSDAGSTWRVTGAPGAAFSWGRLADVADQIASALALPVGCPVLAEPVKAGRKNEVDLKVSTRNYLAEKILYPRDYSALSIRNEHSIGQYLDAAKTMIETHQASGLIVGKKGSGKTTLMQCIIANQIRCSDTLTWAIDLNNGSMAAQWMLASARGEVEHPPLDWVAVHPEEALRMVNALIRIAEERRAAYTAYMMDENETILPVSALLPQINLLVDEGGEVTGDDATTAGLSDEEKKYRAYLLQELTKAIAKLQRIGRAMCCNVIMSYLRATSDLLPSGIKKQNTLSICGKVYDESEIGYTLGWKKGLNHEDLIEDGQFFIRRDGPVRMFKGYLLKPHQILEIVHATQSIRAGCRLDEASRIVAGADYATRWRSPSTVAWLETMRGGQRIDAVPAATGGGVATMERSDFRDMVPDDPIDAMGKALDDLNRPAPPRTARPPAGPTGPGGPTPSSTGPAGPYQPPADDIEHQVDQLSNELEAWGTLTGPRNTTRQPPVQPPAAPHTAQPPSQPAPEPGPPRGADRSPAARQAFIEQRLEAAGDDGLRGGEIVKLVQEGRLASTKDTVYRDLEAMKAAGTVTQTHPVRGEVHGVWWLNRAIGRT